MSLPISSSTQKTFPTQIADTSDKNMNAIQKEISRKVKKTINYILNQPTTTSQGWVNNNAVFDRLENDLVYIKKYVSRLAHEKGPSQAKEQLINRTLVDLTSLVASYKKLEPHASSPELAARLKELKSSIEESMRLVKICKRVLNPNATSSDEPSKENEGIQAPQTEEAKQPQAVPQAAVAINRNNVEALKSFIKIIHDSEVLFDSYEDLYDSTFRTNLKGLLQIIDPADRAFPQQLAAVMNLLFADLASNFSSTIPTRTLSEQHIIRIATREAFEHLAKSEDTQYLRTHGDDENVRVFLRLMLKMLIEVENEAVTNNHNYKNILLQSMLKFLKKNSPEYVKMMAEWKQLDPTSEEFSSLLLTFAQKLHETIALQSDAPNSLKKNFEFVHHSLFPKLPVPEMSKDEAEWQKLMYVMHAEAAKQANSQLLDTMIDQLDWEWNFFNNFEISLNHSSMRIIAHEKMKTLIENAYKYGHEDEFSLMHTLQGFFRNVSKSLSHSNRLLNNILNGNHNPIFDWSMRSNEAFLKQLLEALKAIVSAFNYEQIVIPNDLLNPIRRLLRVAQEMPLIESNLQKEVEKQLAINLISSQAASNKIPYAHGMGARFKRFLEYFLQR